MEQITSSYNLFIDSSMGHNSQSKGDDYLVNLQDAHPGVNAGEGEHIRMSLSNFSMAKNFTDVNDNNNAFEMVLSSNETNAEASVSVDLKLDNRNYSTVTELAENFANKIGNAVIASNINALSTANSTFQVTGLSSIQNDKIITFTITTSGNHELQDRNTGGIFGITIRLYSDESDSYMLLGGDRISGDRLGSTDTATSINVEVPTATTIKVTCLYPAQKSTTPFLYLRAPGLLNTNIETRGLRHPADSHNSDVAHSDILGRAVVESNDWIQFTAQSERDFFLDIHQKQLNVLRLRLTDSKNRLIGRSQGGNTASGTGLSQSTLGNLCFSAVLRFDIVKTKHVHHLETQHHVPNIPARFSEGNVPIKIRE